MNTNNFAQNTNFLAGSSQLNLTNMYLQRVNLPGMSINHSELSGRSGSMLHVPGEVITFNDLSFELMVDENFLIYHEFINKVFNNVSPTSGSFANIEFDFWVQITNSKGFNLFTVDFNSCRITSIGDINFDTTSSETEFLLPVELTYDYFSITMNNVSTPVLRV